MLEMLSDGHSSVGDDSYTTSDFEKHEPYLRAAGIQYSAVIENIIICLFTLGTTIQLSAPVHTVCSKK